MSELQPGRRPRANPMSVLDLVTVPYLVHEVQRIGDWMLSGFLPVFEPPGPDGIIRDPTGYAPIGPAELKRLQAGLQARQILLDKVAPSLKAVDVQAETTIRTRSFSDLELASRVSCLLDQKPQEPAAAALPAPTDYSWL